MASTMGCSTVDRREEEGVSTQERIDEINRRWALAFVEQLKADVIRGKATEEQYNEFMGPRWEKDYPKTVAGVALEFKKWCEFIEGGRTYGA